MNKKIHIVIIVLLLVVLWFTFVSSVIDVFRISFAIADMQDLYSPVELSDNPLFFNLTNAIRIEGLQIVIACGSLLVYYLKRRK